MPTATIFNHDTVILDDETFEDCQFRACRMVYSGGAAPVFKDCKFEDCEWKFEAAAANTLAHMKLVWGAGGKAFIQGLIKEITAAGGGK